MKDFSFKIDVTGRDGLDDGVAVRRGFWCEVNQGQFVYLQPEGFGGDICLFGGSKEQIAEWFEGLAQQVRELPGEVLADPDVLTQAEKALKADQAAEAE